MMDLYVATVPCIVQFDENVVCACVAPMSAVTKAESGWLVTSALRGRDFDREHAISSKQGLSKAIRHCRFRQSLSLRLDLFGLTHINYWHLASAPRLTARMTPPVHFVSVASPQWGDVEMELHFR
jgi:hypothetical protein